MSHARTPLEPNRSLPGNRFAIFAEPDEPKDVRRNIKSDPAQNQAMKRRERPSNPRNATRIQGGRRKKRTTALNPAPMPDSFPADGYNVCPSRQTDFPWRIPKCEFTFSIEGDSRGKPMQHEQRLLPAPMSMANSISSPVKNAAVKLPQSPDHYVTKERDPSMATKGKPLDSAYKQPRIFSFPESQTAHHAMGRSSLFPSPPVVAPPTMSTTLRPATVVISSPAEKAAVSAACRVIANRRHTVPAVRQPQPVSMKIPKPVRQTKARSRTLEVVPASSHTRKFSRQETTSITLLTHSKRRNVSSTVSNLSPSSTYGESSPAVTFSKACEQCQKSTPPSQMQPLICNTGTAIQISPSRTTTSLYTAPVSRPTARMSPVGEVPRDCWRLSQDAFHTVPILQTPVPRSHRRNASQEELEQFLGMGHAKNCWCSIRCSVDSETARGNEDVHNLNLDLTTDSPSAALDDSKIQQLVVPQTVGSPSLESVTLTPSPLGSEFSDLGLLDGCGTNIDVEGLPNECDEDLEWIMVALAGQAHSRGGHGESEYTSVCAFPPDEEHHSITETFMSASKIREESKYTLTSSSDSIGVGQTIPQQDQRQLRPWNPKRLTEKVTTFPSRGSTVAPVTVKLIPTTTDYNGANTSGAEWLSLQDAATARRMRKGITSSTGSDGSLNGNVTNGKTVARSPGFNEPGNRTGHDTNMIEDHRPAEGGGVLLGKKALRVPGGGWTWPGL